MSNNTDHTDASEELNNVDGTAEAGAEGSVGALDRLEGLTERITQAMERSRSSSADAGDANEDEDVSPLDSPTGLSERISQAINSKNLDGAADTPKDKPEGLTDRITKAVINSREHGEDSADVITENPDGLTGRISLAMQKSKELDSVPDISFKPKDVKPDGLTDRITTAMNNSKNGDTPKRSEHSSPVIAEKHLSETAFDKDEWKDSGKKLYDEPKKSDKASSEKKKSKKKNSSETSSGSKKKSNKKKKKYKRSGGQKTGIALGIIFLVLVLAMAAVIFIFYHYFGLLKPTDTSINTEKPPVDSRDIVDGEDTMDEAEKEKELREKLQQHSKMISSGDVMNVLLIGEDIRDTANEDRGMTDVMMLISINRKNRTITLTSLMRDTWVYMNKFDVNDKLNHAYWYGGADYLSEVIQDYFNIKIDRTVKVNFLQFIDIVEAVGGLDLEVSYNEAKAIEDPLGEQNYYLGNDWDQDLVDVSQYNQENEWVEYGSPDEEVIKMHLNGNQSLAYARIRYGCGDDYGRTMRQREVIQEIVKKAKKLSLVQLDALMNKVLPEVETDIEDDEVADLLLNAFDYMDYSIQQLRIPADGYYTDAIIFSQSCLSLGPMDFQANTAIMNYVIYGDCKTSEEAAQQYESELADGTFYEKNGIEPPNYWW